LNALRATIETELSSHVDHKLVNELLDGHAEAKRNYYLGGLRLAEVEGGRFCEAAFRLLEQAAGFTVTPLGKQIDTEKLIVRLQNLPSTHRDSSGFISRGHSDSSMTFETNATWPTWRTESTRTCKMRHLLYL
jgi:hypothetical protein